MKNSLQEFLKHDKNTHSESSGRKSTLKEYHDDCQNDTRQETNGLFSPRRLPQNHHNLLEGLQGLQGSKNDWGRTLVTKIH